MTAWVDAYVRAPRVGKRYEFQSFDGEEWEAELIQIERVKTPSGEDALIIRTDDFDRAEIQTMLPFFWRMSL